MLLPQKKTLHVPPGAIGQDPHRAAEEAWLPAELPLPPELPWKPWRSQFSAYPSSSLEAVLLPSPFPSCCSSSFRVTCLHLLSGGCDRAVGCTCQAVPGFTEVACGGAGKQGDHPWHPGHGGLSVPWGDCQRLAAPSWGQL